MPLLVVEELGELLHRQVRLLLRSPEITRQVAFAAAGRSGTLQIAPLSGTPPDNASGGCECASLR